MENLQFSLQATMPVFLMIVLGYFLGRKEFLTKNFCKEADKLCFRIALPCKLFLDMAKVDMSQGFPVKFIGAPATPSAYIMAKNMGHEGALTLSSIVATTFTSAFTLTIWIFVLKSMRLL